MRYVSTIICRVLRGGLRQTQHHYLVERSRPQGGIEENGEIVDQVEQDGLTSEGVTRPRSVPDVDRSHCTIRTTFPDIYRSFVINSSRGIISG